MKEIQERVWGGSIELGDLATDLKNWESVPTVDNVVRKGISVVLR